MPWRISSSFDRTTKSGQTAAEEAQNEFQAGKVYCYHVILLASIPFCLHCPANDFRHSKCIYSYHDTKYNRKSEITEDFVTSDMQEMQNICEK